MHQAKGFMIPHRGTEPPCSLRLCAGFFYDPAQRHRDHREKQSPPCSLRLCVGYRTAALPESVIIRKKLWLKIHFSFTKFRYTEISAEFNKKKAGVLKYRSFKQPGSAETRHCRAPHAETGNFWNRKGLMCLTIKYAGQMIK